MIYVHVTYMKVQGLRSDLLHFVTEKSAKKKNIFDFKRSKSLKNKFLVYKRNPQVCSDPV